jgi:hypothetical protein
MPNIGAWHDFFLMVGGGAAALAGLVFVAMSINLKTIVQDGTHKNRAIATLVGYTAVFMVCAFALIAEQPYRWFGVEWLIISAVAVYIYVRGLVRVQERGGSGFGSSSLRIFTGIAGYAAQIIGSLMLAVGYIAGLYIASIAMVLSFASLISGAWLLIVAACQPPGE